MANGEALLPGGLDVSLRSQIAGIDSPKRRAVNVARVDAGRTERGWLGPTADSSRGQDALAGGRFGLKGGTDDGVFRTGSSGEGGANDPVHPLAGIIDASVRPMCAQDGGGDLGREVGAEADGGGGIGREAIFLYPGEDGAEGAGELSWGSRFDTGGTAGSHRAGDFIGRRGEGADGGQTKDRKEGDER